jgi:hypothetical protein
MRQINWKGQDIPVLAHYDTIILGGGTAGALAGVAAAREGLQTLIIEQFGSLGGSATMGQVTPLMTSGIPHLRSHCPLGLEISTRMQAIGGSGENDHLFDPTMLAFVLEDMATESDCALLYHTLLAGVVMTGEHLDAVIVCNKDGLTAFTATSFIDCSGDADLAAMAGVDYEIGNHNGVNQPVSLRFEMAGIDFEAFHAAMRQMGNKGHKYFAMNTPGMADLIRQAYDDGLLTEQDAVYFQAFGIPGKPDAMAFNCPELTTKSDVADAFFLTRKQVEGKKAIIRLRRFLRERVPGFEQSYVTQQAPMVGVRESRRIDAVYNMQIMDVLSYRKFDDAIISCNYMIDVHGVDDVTLGLKYDLSVPPELRYWQVPYRCLVAKKTDNLLVAGRCAGLDFRAQSAARIQLVCRAMGEAAGLACALAQQQQIGLHDLDPVLVHDKLVERGMEM